MDTEYKMASGVLQRAGLNKAGFVDQVTSYGEQFNRERGPGMTHLLCLLSIIQILRA